MASSKAATVDQYLAELPAERRNVVSKMRDLVKRNLPKGYAETMNWGMITYELPLARYPNTCTSCLRFKSLDDLPLDAVARIVASTPPEKLIAQYVAARGKR